MFREPQCVVIASSGDNRRFLWVMEPTLGRIFGKAFLITGRSEVLYGPAWVAERKQEAYEEMLERSKDDRFLMPEGSLWEDFL